MSLAVLGRSCGAWRKLLEESWGGNMEARNMSPKEGPCHTQRHTHGKHQSYPR